MDRTESNQNKILSALGLSRKMKDFNRTEFQTYVPPKYRGSALEERDDVHRMSEIVLLHAATGLRLSYLRTESYYGESVDYTLIGIEVITTSGQAHRVVDVDFETRLVVTENEQIPFFDLSKKI